MSYDPPYVQLGAFEAQAEPGAAAAVDRTLKRDRASVRLGDIFHDRKSQAGTGKVTRVIRPPEAVEHTGNVLRRDTWTVIAHRDLAVRDRHVDRRARRTVFGRVVEQICDRARDTDLDAVDRRRRRRHVEVHLGIAEGHVVDDLVHDLVEPQLLERHRGLLVARDLDEIADEGRETLDLADEITEQLLALDGVGRLTPFEELEVRPEAGEGSAELVRCVGDQLALRPKRGLELAKHGVEARPEPAELVATPRGDAT